MPRGSTRWIRTGRALGEGGQAQVLVVTDGTRALDGEFAQKILKNPTRRDRFFLEVRKMKDLISVGCSVMTIVDDFTETDPEAQRPWYVSPVADGGTLRAGLPAGQPYVNDEVRALETFRKLHDAVQGIHAKGVAHRDLKPENIFIHQQKVLLGDLGLCLALDDARESGRITGSDEPIGSLHYMPPEAFGKVTLDESQFAFDAYALGKILYELLAGRRLPGFSATPYDPQYDLSPGRNRLRYALLNPLIAGLVAEDPRRRMDAFRSVPTVIGEALARGNSPAPSPHLDLTDKMVISADRITRYLAQGSPARSVADLKGVAKSYAAAIDELWKKSSVLSEIRQRIVAPSGGALALNQSQGPRLREMLAGPYSRTHRGMEPFEDKGYPFKPGIEEAVTIELSSTNPDVRFPHIALGAMVSVSGSKPVAAFGVVHAEAGPDGYVDLVAPSLIILEGVDGGEALVPEVLTAAEASLRNFVKEIERITRKLG